MRSIIGFAVLTCLCSVLGCNKAGQPPSMPSTGAPAATIAEATNIAPAFAPVEVSIRDKEGSNTATFTPLPVRSGIHVKHGSEYGHSGKKTTLSWQYLGTTDQGDRY